MGPAGGDELSQQYSGEVFVYHQSAKRVSAALRRRIPARFEEFQLRLHHPDGLRFSHDPFISGTSEGDPGRDLVWGFAVHTGITW